MVTIFKKALKPGSRVTVPWGVADERAGVVVEVWGDPKSPSHVRVRLTASEPGEESPVLLLSPSVITPA